MNKLNSLEQTQDGTPVIPTDKFVFVPLGGATGIGMNFFAYGYRGKWLLVDCGIGFAGDGLPGVDLLLPDPKFLADKKQDIIALVITHGHEDHIGAIPYLWRDLNCPVYATPFAAELIESKLDEAGLLGRVELNVVEPGSALDLSPFEVEFISMTHSIPEPNALAIRTKKGLVVHTGDWKIDNEPLIGEKMDWEALKDLGKEGVLALVCDSTNVFAEACDKTELDVRHSLTNLIADWPGRQIAVTCFASNVARIESICHAAKANGREVCLMGRSLWRIDAAARATGYFKGLPPFLSEEEAADREPGRVLFICTGSQGEPFSALNQLASKSGGRGGIRLLPGDVVIFSSRVIPGNEKSIALLQKRLRAKELKIITHHDALVHVSGHYSGGELEKLYAVLKPHIALPVHGEAMELEAHVELAKQWGVPYAEALQDGDVISLTETPEILGDVPTGILALDGKRIVPLNSDVIKKKKKMVDDGTLVATIVLNAAGQVLGRPQIAAFGLVEPNSPEMDELTASIITELGGLDTDQIASDELVETAARTAIRRFLKAYCGKKPLIEVHLVRI